MGSGIRDQGSGIRDQGSGIRDQGSGIRDQGSVPAVSILIPVYNGAKHVTRALDSVLGQNFLNFELVCVDDGSTDGTAKILEKYVAKDLRVRVVTSKKNFGTLHARVTAVRAARGDYVMWLDADDHFLPNIVEICHGAAVANAVDMVLFRLLTLPIGRKEARFFKEGNLPANQLGHIFKKNELLYAIEEGLFLVPIFLFNKIIRRTVFLDAANAVPSNLLEKHICCYEDMLLIIPVLLKINACLTIPDFGCCHIVAPTSLVGQQAIGKGFHSSMRDHKLVKDHLLATTPREAGPCHEFVQRSMHSLEQFLHSRRALMRNVRQSLRNS
ncbi:MAG: glycosyltransferase [Puniceicoccales bacterium]|jgi:hypothetical protein|nr:glycosyltransferase [Puniceicoccales bacterium]